VGGRNPKRPGVVVQQAFQDLAQFTCRQRGLAKPLLERYPFLAAGLPFGSKFLLERLIELAHPALAFVRLPSGDL